VSEREGAGKGRDGQSVVGFWWYTFAPILIVGPQPYHSNSHSSGTIPAQLSYWGTLTKTQISENTLTCYQSNSISNTTWRISGFSYVIFCPSASSLIRNGSPTDFTFFEKQLPKILLGAILPDVSHPHLNSLTKKFAKMENSGTNKMTTIILRNITTSLTRGRILETLILEMTGTIKNNLSLIWRVLAPHIERMFLHLNQAGAARSGLVVSLSFYGILFFFMGYGHGDRELQAVFTRPSYKCRDIS